MLQIKHELTLVFSVHFRVFRFFTNLELANNCLNSFEIDYITNLEKKKSALIAELDNMRLQAAAVAAFSKMTVQDTRKLLPPEFYPSWVVFSQRQKLSYLYLLKVLFLTFPESFVILIWDFLLLSVELAQPRIDENLALC